MENVDGVTAVSLPDGKDIDVPTGFDYSGMDEQKALKLQNLARRAVLVKRRYALDMMEIVVEAHQLGKSECFMVDAIPGYSLEKKEVGGNAV